LDTDVLVNSDVNVLFNTEISPDKLHALEEGEIGHPYWGGQFFDFANFERNTPAFSAGVFYFLNSPSMKQLFADTNAHIANYSGPTPVCLDQPFLVYNSFIQNKCDNQFMKKYLENNPSSVSREKIIYHFPGGPGDFSSKWHKMTAFWEKMKYSICHQILANQFTMVSKERLINLYNQCEKFRNTSYSFVECGVAKGGCLSLMAHVASKNNKIYGFDSFEGMPAITNKDLGDYNKSNIHNGVVGLNLSGGIESVYTTFQTLHVDMKNTTLIKGFFQDTLNVPENIDNIGEIGVLRLDGDWYESTLVCLEKLYDKVVVGGVIIIDDYGHWVGAKRATDEFRTKYGITSPLMQTDYTEHYWIKRKEMYSDLCMIGKKYAVDKTPFFGNHTYTPHYDNLLKHLRNDTTAVLEIGIGNIPLMRGLTNESYMPGASLRMWREYFPNARIFGCDILESVLFNEERISTFLTDQSNETSLNNLIASIGDNLDLIIDDGSHVQEHMVTSFKTLWKSLKKNGLYIIEDIHNSFFDRMTKLNSECNLFDATCVMTYKGKFISDNFVAFKKIDVFETRNDMLTHFCSTMTNPKLLEIGVFRGDFLEFLVTQCGSIDAVDLFQGVTCSGNVDGNNVVHYDVGRSYLELLVKYREMSNVRIIQSHSVSFLSAQEDNTYDIIYLDGDHSYNGVKNDLLHAFRKIKNNGYIMGHDYEMNMKKAHNAYSFGVKQAVDEFCLEHGQTILAKALDGCVSYCIRVHKN
jgi:O-methyltransferase